MTVTPDAPAVVTQFLIEISRDDQAGWVMVFDIAGLTTFLAKNIEDVHYSGEGDDIKGIWRYDGDGKLARLTLVCENPGDRADSDDYLHWSYGLADPSGSKVLGFTVRIDGRS